MPDIPLTLTVDEAHRRYEAIRPRLPQIGQTGPARLAARLLDTAEHYDGYLFDAFGVLNVGETAIPGAAACLAALRAIGKRFCILTNAASYTSAVALAKYHALGLDVRAGEVVSSRDVLFAHLGQTEPGLHWAAICAAGDRFEDAPVPVLDLAGEVADWDAAEGFVFLSSARWDAALQERLVASLQRHPRPVAVGNPDLVAPREGGLTIEPGYWAHDVQDRTGIAPVFFGKPYPEAFLAGAQQLGGGRIAMVGDTLHTDILGGHAAGFDTILVTQHGLYAGRQSADFIADSGIIPTWQIPSI